jgi:hypothetical protein
MVGASIMIAATLCFLAIGAAQTDVPRKVVAFPRTYGNHRARVSVDQAADAVCARIPWRRHDERPDLKDVVVIDVDGKVVANRLVVSITDEEGLIVFQPTKGIGTYFVYYMPYTQTGWVYMPTIQYNPPKETADPTWTAGFEKSGVAQLPAAQVEAFESRSEFDAFGPMEQAATEAETSSLLKKSGPYAVFPEDRLHPIAMTDRLPARWKDGPAVAVEGKAARDELFAFQLGVWAAKQDLADVRLTFSELTSPSGRIPAGALKCINLGGTDWLGRAFTKQVDVAKGRVQALWCGVQVPANAKPGRYVGKVVVKPKNAPSTSVPIEVEVTGARAKDHGDGDLKSMARLRWLDSTIGLDDEVVAPFTPLKVKGNEVQCIQRKVVFGAVLLPERIVSKGRDVLAGPIEFKVIQNGQALPWKTGKAKTLKNKPATYERGTKAEAGGIAMTCRTKMEADGYIDTTITLKAIADTPVDDLRLEIPYRKDAATYFMGLGRKGGYRPKEWRWKWDVNFANHMYWFGDVEAGLQCKLKTGDTWDLYNLKAVGLPKSWDNDGKGGVTIDEIGDTVATGAFTGPRVLKAGEELTFRFALLITPVKPLNPAHWSQRYYHVSDWKSGTPKEMFDAAIQNGATVLNIHQGNPVNPYINYPFVTADKIAQYTAEGHRRGIKTKIYYTVRELSNRVAEMWPIRSLGFEVFTDGPGGGDSWLQEHLGSNYAPAWHSPLDDGQVDAAVATVGLSRWHNYYLEGLSWLIKNAGIDGLYLDGIGYDRQIMKRVRKVMDRAKPGCLIDFHSGNNYQPEYGLNSCASGYMEHFPYVDSLWFGEMFDYNASPDYWLVEVSGIPFGLYGEMLQDNGNPWRGMVYGMTARYYSGADPKHIWKLWDDFGIAEARMTGYWSPDCPVRTDNPDVLATAYVGKGKTLIAIGSWAKEAVKVHLKIDWKALGLDPAKARLTAPAVKGVQEAASFGPNDAIPVEPGKGWMLVLAP